MSWIEEPEPREARKGVAFGGGLLRQESRADQFVNFVDRLLNDSSAAVAVIRHTCPDDRCLPRRSYRLGANLFTSTTAHRGLPDVPCLTLAKKLNYRSRQRRTGVADPKRPSATENSIRKADSRLCASRAVCNRPNVCHEGRPRAITLGRPSRWKGLARTLSKTR